MPEMFSQIQLGEEGMREIYEQGIAFWLVDNEQLPSELKEEKQFMRV